MQIFVKGDCHGDLNFLISFCKNANTSKEDVMVLLGDIGLNYNEDLREHCNFKKLAEIPITLICINGNHEKRPQDTIDCMTQEEAYTYEWIEKFQCYGYVNKIASNVIFPVDGIFKIDKFSCLGVGGAYSIDKDFRLLMGWKWFETEQLSKEEQEDILMAIDNISNQFDFVFSHTAPFSWLSQLQYLFLKIPNLKADYTMEHFLEKVKNKINYKQWFFGHFHNDKQLKDNAYLLYNKIIKIN